MYTPIFMSILHHFKHISLQYGCNIAIAVHVNISSNADIYLNPEFELKWLTNGKVAVLC